MNAAKQVLELSGLKELNPVQALAVEKGLDKSLIVAAPTASGKTLIAEIAALQTVQRGKKVIYIVPLRALAHEKYREFKAKYESLGYKIGLSIGDLDAADPWLASYDVIIATSEKLDSLLRHGITWAREIGLVVADEIHLLNDPSRGPTLEMVLTRLKAYKPVILGLSATINNFEELARWLEADAVRSDYRPVKLYTGVAFEGEVTFVPDRRYDLSENYLHELTSIPKQSLLFISTRRGTEATAEKLGAARSLSIEPTEANALEALAKKITSSLEHTTPQCERLARCIRTGTAFHHAGLTNKQRTLVEDGFKQGLLKLICATPTLAAGLNLPAYRVIIRDLKRFSSFRGMDYLPILEVQQMAGRAGRPAFDKEGEAILLPKNRQEADYAWKHYVHGEPEKIYSKLGVEPVLRTHVLALIAGGVCSSRKELVEFFSRTFYAYQYQDMTQLKAHLDKILSLLQGFEFITMEGAHDEFTTAFVWEEDDASLKPTKIGRRVSELYIDPLTADFLIRSLKRLHEPQLFTVLHMLAKCMEMKPGLNLRKRDFEAVEEVIAREEHNLLEKPPSEWELEYEDFLREVKMASLFLAWSNEAGEDRLLEAFGVAPGELRARLDIADWLLYASQELTLLSGEKSLLKELRKARLRVKHGIREELLPFIRLKGVGRVRARRLHSAGITSLAKLRNVSEESLARLVGTATAKRIQDQL